MRSRPDCSTISGVPKPDVERVLTWLAVLVEAGGSLTAADFARQCGVRPHQVGGVVAQHWQLPPPLVEVIRFHHAPAQAGEHSRLAAAVHLSDCVSHGVGEPGIETAPTPSMCSDVWTLLGGLTAGMGPDEIHRCVSRLKDEAPSVEMLTGVLAAA